MKNWNILRIWWVRYILYTLFGLVGIVLLVFQPLTSKAWATVGGVGVLVSIAALIIDLFISEESK